MSVRVTMDAAGASRRQGTAAGILRATFVLMEYALDKERAALELSELNAQRDRLNKLLD